MRKILAPVSRQILSAIWNLFPTDRRDELVTLEHSLELAKALVHVVHPNDEVAEALLIEAARLMAANGNPTVDRGRKGDVLKVPLTSKQMLQRFVFAVLDRSEKFQEETWFAKAAGDEARAETIFDESNFSPYLKDGLLDFPTWDLSLDTHGLVARYLKQLVAVSFDYYNVKRVLMGVPKLAYRYSSTEVTEIAERLDGNPEFANFKKSFSKIRIEFIDDLLARFGPLLKQVKDPKSANEWCFEGQQVSRLAENPPSVALAEYCGRCLETFAPWGLSLPEFDGRQSVVGEVRAWTDKLISSLGPRGRMAMNYAILHPEGFKRIVAEVVGPVPEALPPARLALPEFQTPHWVAGNGGDPMSNSSDSGKGWHWRFAPQPPRVGAIRAALDDDAARRKEFSDGRITVVADGRRAGEFSTSEGGISGLKLAATVKSLDLIARDSAGEFPLAAYLLDRDEEGGLEPRNFQTTLAGGQRIRVAIRPTPTGGEAAIEFFPGRRVGMFGWLTPGVAVALATLLIALFVGIYIMIGKKAPAPTIVTNPPVVSPNPPKSESAAPERQAQDTPPKATPPKSQPKLPAIVVECGQSDLDRKFCAALKAELAASGKWRVVSKPERGAFRLRRETLLSGEGTEFRLELTDGRDIPKWSGTEFLTDENYLDKARATVLELSRMGQRR